MKNGFLIIASVFLLIGCKTKEIQELPPENIISNEAGEGQTLEIKFEKGSKHNHPLMAAWLEDMDGNYIQSLFVAKSIATGVFEHGKTSEGHWEAGEIRRPAALPVWSHKRGIKAKDGLYTPGPDTKVPDAYTGATPMRDFVLLSKLDKKLSGKFRIRLEINQTWDWNEFWTNNKYPDNEEYKTSCQPALVYEAIVDFDSGEKEYPMKVIGHSHYAGENGEINDDLSTITTALNIIESLSVRLINN
ncbi:MAG: hypothetical protein K9H49_12395 [Bacteroidales bacterium]|nr:hypothetical protein [Bacteroidales bacterium]MCF8390687.1 hypothetical protein [Bacteroidales bacterium]